MICSPIELSCIPDQAGPEPATVGSMRSRVVEDEITMSNAKTRTADDAACRLAAYEKAVVRRFGEADGH